MAETTSTKLDVTSRTAGGSREVRRLRRSGRVPGVLYGGEGDSVSFDADARELRLALARSGAVLDLSVDGGKATPAALEESQRGSRRRGRGRASPPPRPLGGGARFERGRRQSAPGGAEGESARPGARGDRARRFAESAARSGDPRCRADRADRHGGRSRREGGRRARADHPRGERGGAADGDP